MTSTTTTTTTTPAQQQQAEPCADELDDMLHGMMYASLAITDDKELTLEKTGKDGPWHIEALKLITGNSEQAHKPLTTLLKEHMNLHLDKHIDVRRVTKGGQFVDTQGYIAHNDDVIVLSYRCTTSGFDWLTNFQTTSSAWELDIDIPQGFSGICSELEGLMCCWGGTGRGKPRVHTGFYNNFLATVPDIKEYVEPLLGPGQPPRTLFVTGHSLGAGVATLATCYFLLEYDWEAMPQTLRSVTAGSPRACGTMMAEIVEEHIRKSRSSGVRVYRLVKGRDVVATVPPAAFGFQHISEPVTIDDNGKIILHPCKCGPSSSTATAAGGQGSMDTSERELDDLVHKVPSTDDTDNNNKDVDGNNNNSQSKYEKLVAKIPAPLRDHMPDFYLKPMMRARGMPIPSSSPEAEATKD